MVILSAGMPKSGSGYLYNILNALLVAAGNTDARQIKAGRNLEDLMKWHNNNIGELSLQKLIRLWLISIQDGSFAVKTHKGPKRSTKVLNTLGLLRIVYCYRDPRDVLLSAVDHGKRIIEEGGNHTFAKMVDSDKASKKVKSWLGVWERYNDMTGVMMVKYEDMMEKPIENTKKMVAFLKISVTNEQLEDIIWKFSRDNPDGDRSGMHFNKAKTHRYKTEITEAQKTKYQEAFGDYLEAMGYETE
jgi:hypothetical protein